LPHILPYFAAGNEGAEALPGGGPWQPLAPKRGRRFISVGKNGGCFHPASGLFAGLWMAVRQIS